MKILLTVTITFWVVWLALDYSARNVERWRLEDRRRLTAADVRVSIAPGTKIVQNFQVNHGVPHYVGLKFDDKDLSDALDAWDTSSVPGFELNWTLYCDNDSMQHASLRKADGTVGQTMRFGQFEAKTGRPYQLEMQIVSLPKYAVQDSANLEIGVALASVSVGNELGNGMIEAVASWLRVPMLLVSLGFTVATLVVWRRKRVTHGSNH